MKNDHYRLEAKEVAAQARGKWLSIFQYVCPGVFDAAIHQLGQHVTCPFHGGEDDFRFIKTSRRGKSNTAECGVAMCTCGVFTDGFAVIQQATGKRFYDVLVEVDEYLNGPRELRRTAPPPPRPVVPEVKGPTEEEMVALRAQVLERLRAMWNVSKPVRPDSATYYEKRGISREIFTEVRDLRALHQLGYYSKLPGKDELEKIGSFPALLGLMRDANGEPVAIHRTWLSEDRTQKAPVIKPKKLTRAISVVGAAIRLFCAKGCDTLGVTEGIETALAVRELSASGTWADLTKIPVWACFAERNIRNFQIPKDLQKTLKRLVIFADHDERGTGMTAALALKERLAKEMPQLIVIIRQPAVMGWDWLDYLANKKMDT